MLAAAGSITRPKSNNDPRQANFMHAREMIELAAFVTQHSQPLIEGPYQGCSGSIHAYWSSSRFRADRWSRALKTLTVSFDYGKQSTSAVCGSGALGLIEEILAAGVLARVWAAVLHATDYHHNENDTSPVAGTVSAAHAECEQRAISLIARPGAFDDEAATGFDRLRRKTERWTDMLVGCVAIKHDVARFAANPASARSFAGEARRQRNLRANVPDWNDLFASLEFAFRDELISPSPNADLNGRVAASITSCFSADLLDTVGLPRSLWLTQIAARTTETAGMIEELFRLEAHT